MKILTIDNLSIRFSPSSPPIFTGVSFTIEAGSIFGVFGETGCGKSTLAQSLVGFIPHALITGEIWLHAEEGRIALHEVDEIFMSAHIRGQNISYVPQDPYTTLNPYESVLAQLQRLCEQYRHRTANDILEMVTLPLSIAKKYPDELSSGQRQRAMVALALAAAPTILIFDEPTASIDREGRELMLRCFAQLTAEGHTVIIISHEIFSYRELIPESQRFYFSDPPSQLELNVSPLRKKVKKPLLQIQGICKSFSHFEVLKNLNWDIYSHQWLYLEGANGSGKSTLLAIITGLLAPDTGSIQWQGQRGKDWLRYLHPVFQDSFHSLNPRLPISQSIREIVSLCPEEKRNTLQELCVDLWQELELPATLADKLPRQLSYGQQKRIAILRTLLKYHLESICDPQAYHLFLLDEVFCGIHWPLRQRIIALFLKMYRDKCNFSLVWIAHGHDQLRSLCHQAYVLNEGQLVIGATHA